MTTTMAPEAPRYDAAVYVLTADDHWHPARLYRNLTERQALDLLATEGAVSPLLPDVLRLTTATADPRRRVGIAAVAA